jgi:hypothetical protein
MAGTSASDVARTKSSTARENQKTIVLPDVRKAFFIQ